MGSPRTRAAQATPASIHDEPLLGALQAAKAGRHAEAEATLQSAAQRFPRSSAARYALALVLQAAGRAAEAREQLAALLELEPGHREGRVLLGRILYDLEQDGAARSELEPLVQADPEDFEAARHLLTVLMRIADVPAVLALTARWLETRPEEPFLRACHAWAVEMQGDEDAAAATYFDLIARGERAADSWHRLARLGRPLDADAIAALAHDPGLDDGQRSVAAFALGEAHKKARRWDEAFEAFALGNSLMNIRHDREQHRALVERTLELADPGLLARLASQGDPDEAPIFIVGMPRSGTSLVEQILGAHSGVQQLGERSEIAELARDMPEWLGMAFPGGLLGISRRLARRQARAYKEAVGVDPQATRFTDKAPGNWLFLGLIAALFPKARIVHCRRNPLDTVVSNFFTNFGPTRCQSSYALEDLRWSYENYARAMQRWREVLPLPILDLDYERLVQEGEPQMRRLIEFAGLEWEEACGRPHESKRRCMTASSHQVSKPIHGGSVAAWRRYESHLQDLLPLLDLWQDPLAASA
jgi:tetratricopeptide (TPR) repeat protein